MLNQTYLIISKNRFLNDHPYHLVDPSPWPLFVSIASFALTLSIVLYFHSYKYGLFCLVLAFCFIVSIMCFWWRDVVRESTFRGYHTIKVVNGLRIGVILFIMSEVMFFLSFFWAFFHSSLNPSIEIGGVWPPKNMLLLNAFGVPFLNTLLLLTSGATVTFTHYCIQMHNRLGGLLGFISTLMLAVVFTLFQVFEYIEAPFNLSDGIFASTFFLATGFHGFHVIIGTFFLLVGFLRFFKYHFNFRHHLGFESAAWYWHFVDVVWLFLFVCVYFWGSY